jgi:hypothetical protein
MSTQQVSQNMSDESLKTLLSGLLTGLGIDPSRISLQTTTTTTTTTTPIPVQQPTNQKLQLYTEGLDYIRTTTLQEFCSETKLTEKYIRNCISHNKVCRGLRLRLIDNDDNDEPQTLTQTVATVIRSNKNIIFKLDPKTRDIVSVYPSSYSAALQTALDSETDDNNRELLRRDLTRYLTKHSDALIDDSETCNAKILTQDLQTKVNKIQKSITNRISDGTLAYGFAWSYLTGVNETILSNYTRDHQLPTMFEDKNQHKIYKYDTNNILIKVYRSVADAATGEGCTDSSITRYCSHHIMFNNHYFKRAHVQ